ncbi:hypothetical protein M1P56_35280 (plasmid) [Streptomyces sp. HU2014]|uniref:hypothetical protein n=1 Tax=Streptomyces sp. HU2014 TaxID=2939414 RepID=UPI00200E43BF|nr:hypothetical protein [Streptomyces sp. HU2014]UQI49656.1 hypothetical protein M1P56_35280 [Streptomyces sp. HU2014]
MSLASLDQRRRAARRRLALLATGILIGGAGVTAFFVLGSDDAGSGVGQREAAPSASAPAAIPSGGSNTPTVLPKPKEVKEGVPVGYPHTLEGAVSAAAHFTDVNDLFTPDVAERQARVMAEPNYLGMLGTYARMAAQEARKARGLPENGESDTANFYANQSRAYSIDSAASDKVTIWILVDSTISVKGVSKNITEVRGAIMIWAEGDWKMSFDTLDGLPEEQPSPATPGSAQALDEGWRALAYEK